MKRRKTRRRILVSKEMLIWLPSWSPEYKTLRSACDVLVVKRSIVLPLHA